MSVAIPRPILKDKKALVIGIANEHSIAYGCAKAFRELGADLAITYVNEKAKPLRRAARARARSADLHAARRLAAGRARRASSHGYARNGAGSISSCIRSRWRRRRTCKAVCSIARPKASRRRWTSPAIRFVRMARLAAPLMTDGGTMLTMSYHGANKVVPNYNLMGPVKAALEACSPLSRVRARRARASACTRSRRDRSRRGPRRA